MKTLNLDDLPSPSDILAIDNRIVKSNASLWLNGILTWEQALMAMVYGLAKSEATLVQANPKKAKDLQ